MLGALACPGLSTEEGGYPQVPWGAWTGFPSQGVCNPCGAEGLVGRCGVEGSALCGLARGSRLVWRVLLGSLCREMGERVQFPSSLWASIL